MSKQAHRRKMVPDALGVGDAGKPAPSGKVERTDHAERDRLAMEEAIREAGGGLEGMPEGMAEVEQRPFAGLALVARDGQCLGPATHRNRMLACGPARDDLAPVGLEPGEEGRVA